MAHVPTPAAPELNCVHRSAANGIVLEEFAGSGDNTAIGPSTGSLLM
jgi:hypothetical protein